MFLIDTDVLITAKNAYYAFDICPGFWQSLIIQHQVGQVHSLDRVRQELLQGRDDDELVQWLHRDVPADFFLASHDADVVAAYTDIMFSVQRNPQYQDSAKAKFATGADGWLVAHAKVNGHVIVTNEQPRPEARNQIKLPDVCEKFGVGYQDSFGMLKALQIRFHYAVNG